MRVERLLYLVVFFFQFVGAWAVQAGTAEPQQEAVQGEPRPEPQEYEVTVTATRTAVPLTRTGQAVTVITSEEIEARGITTVKDVLETIPGFHVVEAGSAGAVTSVFVRGGESDFNLVLIDGVQVNEPGGLYDFADLTVANIERIEVVRGPSSVLYGADAVSSTIHIITRQGSGRPSGTFLADGGSFDSWSVSGQVAGASPRVKYSLGARKDDTAGALSLNNEYNVAEFSFRGGFQLRESGWLNGIVRFRESELGIPTSFTGAVIDPDDYRESDETVYTVSYEDEISSRYSMRVGYGYHRRDFLGVSPADYIDDFFDSSFRSAHNRNTLDWQNDIRLGSNHLLTGGASWDREESEVGGSQRRSLGFFVQDQMSLSDRVVLAGGVRYDNNDQFKDFVTANISLSWRLNKDWKLRSSLGNGFRAPAFYEVEGFPEFGILGSPDLKPEKNVAFDVGVDFQEAELSWGGSFSFFVNRFSDLIEFSFLVPAGEPNYLNVESARAWGVEGEAFRSLGDRWKLGAYYTFLQTRVTEAGTTPGGGFEEGQELLRRPTHRGGAFLEFRVPRASLRVDGLFVGRRDDIQFFPDFSSLRVRLPSYFTAGFAARLPISPTLDGRTRVSLVFRGDNLFDKDYTPVAGFEAAGRILRGGVEFGF